MWASATVRPGGNSSAGTSRIRITSPSMRVSCTSTRAAAGVLARNSRSPATLRRSM